MSGPCRHLSLSPWAGPVSTSCSLSTWCCGWSWTTRRTSSMAWMCWCAPGQVSAPSRMSWARPHAPHQEGPGDHTMFREIQNGRVGISYPCPLEAKKVWGPAAGTGWCRLTSFLCSLDRAPSRGHDPGFWSSCPNELCDPVQVELSFWAALVPIDTGNKEATSSSQSPAQPSAAGGRRQSSVSLRVGSRRTRTCCPVAVRGALGVEN